MIYHFFNSESGEFLYSREYPENRKPQVDCSIWTGNLPQCKSGNGLVLVKDSVKEMSPLEFAEYRISIGNLILKPNQKLDAEGRITDKTQTELLLESSKLTYDLIYSRISDWAGRKITEGFISKALGSEHMYDTSLEDQFNFKSVKDASIDFPVRCRNLKSDVKTYVMHTKEQIKQVHDEFLLHKNGILKKADEEKKSLKEMYENKNTSADLIERFSAYVSDLQL